VSESETNTGPALAFVLLSKAEPPDPQSVIASAAKLGLTLALIDASDMQTYDAGDGRSLIVMSIAAPHPDAATMGFGPTAVEPDEAAKAPAHLIVTALGLAGTPRERDTLMAAMTACVVDNVPAVGAMLGHGVVFHKAKVFSGLAALGIEQGAIPSELAIDITTVRDSESRMSFRTYNLPRYGRENFYVTAPIRGKGALDFVMGLVRWMLNDPSKQLPTGETVGRSPTEKITIHRVLSPEGETHIRLDLPDV
jgi:hypothetical protein